MAAVLVMGSDDGVPSSWVWLLDRLFRLAWMRSMVVRSVGTACAAYRRGRAFMVSCCTWTEHGGIKVVARAGG